MSRLRAPLALLFAALLPGLAHAQPPLGRLFFSPAERVAMDRGTDHTENPADSAPRVLNGIVRRSNGKATVWIDGKPETRRLPSANAAVIETPAGTWQRLKVGESTDASVNESPKIRIEPPR